MSDDSFADFRQADGRFAKGNRGGPGSPRARDRIVAIELVDLERRMTALEEEGARLRGEKP